MNNPTEAPTPDSPSAETEPVKPVRRRRTVKAPGEDGAVASPTAEGATEVTAATATSAPPEADEPVAAKPVRKRRVAAVADEPADDPAPKVGPAEPGPAVAAPDPAPLSNAAPVEATAAPGEVVSSVTVVAQGADTAVSGESGEAANGEAGAAAGEGAGGEAGDARPDRSRRRNRRERQRANRAAEAEGQGAQSAPGGSPQAAPLPPQAVEQLGALFAQVVSGDFDTEEPSASNASGEGDERVEPVSDTASGAASDAAFVAGPDGATDAVAATDAGAAESAEGAAHKRVLAPDPDAPKLQKVLGQAGVGSRRDMEELIADGRVTVNGEPAHTGQRISWGDRIEVNGRAIKYRIAPPPARIIAYHKPVGEVVTHDDPQQRPTVFRSLPRLQHGKWQSVGRLDINTEGLLLFTTSGELANQLMHPRFGVEREYAVRVLGTLEPEARERLLQGVMVEGQPASFKAIEDGGGEGANHWYRVVITEGRNREVRKLFDTVGLTVSRLIRIRYGSVVLPRGLKRGVWVDLGQDDVRLIRQLAGGARNGERQHDGAGQRGSRGPQGGDRGPRPNDRGGRNDRGPRRDVPAAQGQAQAHARPGPQADRDVRDPDEDLDFDPMRIPNPLEQTFDRRFAKNQRSPFSGRTMAHGGGGFGAGGSAPDAASRHGGGPKEPDPLQTSLSFIGGDAFHRKSGRGGGGGGQGGGNRGGQRGGPRGGGKGGQRGR
jgi:23S rRNA pseudouridine2605 synthase